MRAVGRRERGPLLALEIVGQDHVAAVDRQDQVNTGSLEIGIEQKMRVRNDDGSRGRVSRRSIEPHMIMRGRTEAVGEMRGARFTSVIHGTTDVWLIIT